MAARRLQTVIKVKSFQTKKAQRELAVLTIDREREEGTLDRLADRQSEAMSDAVRENRTRAASAQASRAFIQTLSREIQQQSRRVDQIKAAEDGKRDEVVERSKSEKMIRKLEERRRDEEVKETERKAQRLIDVLAQRVRPGR